MRYRIQMVVGLIVIQAALAVLWWWLLQPDEFGRYNFTVADAPQRISQIMGMVMGGLLGVSPVLFLLARSNDRRKAEARAQRF